MCDHTPKLNPKSLFKTFFSKDNIGVCRKCGERIVPRHKPFLPTVIFVLWVLAFDQVMFFLRPLISDWMLGFRILIRFAVYLVLYHLAVLFVFAVWKWEPVDDCRKEDPAVPPSDEGFGASDIERNDR